MSGWAAALAQTITQKAGGGRDGNRPQVFHLWLLLPQQPPSHNVSSQYSLKKSMIFEAKVLLASPLLPFNRGRGLAAFSGVPLFQEGAGWMVGKA